MSKRKSEEHDNFYHYDDRDYECKKPNCNVTKFRSVKFLPNIVF